MDAGERKEPWGLGQGYRTFDSKHEQIRIEAGTNIPNTGPIPGSFANMRFPCLLGGGMTEVLHR